MEDYTGMTLHPGDEVFYVAEGGYLTEGTVMSFLEDEYEDEYGPHQCNKVTVESKFWKENNEGDLYHEIDNVSPFQCIKKQGVRYENCKVYVLRDE